MIYFIALISLIKDHLGSILSLIGIIISYSILKSTISALNEQNRPFISLSIETIKKPTNLYFIIRNTGNRVAENVVIRSNPKFISFSSINKNTPSIHDKDGVIKLSGIAPNQEIVSVFDHGVHRFAKDVNSVDKSLITICYSYKKKKYKEKLVIDFSYLSVASNFSTPEDIDKNIKRIADDFKDLIKSIDKINCS